MTSSRMELRVTKSSIPAKSAYGSFSKPALSLPVTESERLNNIQTITVTKCLSQECSGCYTDTLYESILILCKDSKHHNAGQVTNQRPAKADDNISGSVKRRHGT
jgi:hypothetical protein